MDDNIKKTTAERYDIIPADLAIKAMRANGFKSTDYAIAELIDNSIQSGIKVGLEKTSVEVICIERLKQFGSRSTKRIDEILVYDNAGGMGPELLRKSLMFGSGTNLDPKQQKGMGKFGMGLPNASISQCQLVTVYSWQNKKVYKTYLDVSVIMNKGMRDVPMPELTTLPKKYKKLIKSTIGASGTLVVWQHLDRPTWVRHQAFFKNSEFLIGRMYRRFIQDGTAVIRFSAYDRVGETDILLDELFVRPNDPLMVLTNTTAPKPFDENPAFELFDKPDEVKIKLPDGTISTVIITYAVAKQSTREIGEGQAAGSTPIGKYVARNVGVSILRAGRELEMNKSWVNPSEPRERWWGIEIEFQPELDDIFGVSNNKQTATGLYCANYKEDADNLGMKPSELMLELQETNDPRIANYEISTHIMMRLKTLRKHIDKQMKGKNKAKKKGVEAEHRATEALRRRMEEIGKTATDIDFENATDEEKQDAVREAMEAAGVAPERASEIAVETVSSGIRYIFSEVSLSSPAFFDLSQDRGEYFIKLNIDHPVYKHLIDLLKDNDGVEDTPALVGLKLLLTAWARLEDEAEGQNLERLQDIRHDWGRITRDYLREL